MRGDVRDHLLRTLEDAGLGPWITDADGAVHRLHHWVDDVVRGVVDQYSDTDAPEKLAALLEELDSKPDRKSVSVKIVREIVAPA
ncbi:hypothetical protein [Saccharothrix sp. HUAS TT1]|uniref:hypothetical protein n=1 Tax=unclassified Saccharothrix TaxID=2593673 RepID=UPI00345C1C50